MIKVDQRQIHDPDNGKTGDCLSAVLSSLLHIPIEDIPIFAKYEEEYEWLRELNKWLKPKGLAFINLNADWCAETFELLGITGVYSDIVGPSPRHDGVDHAMVGLDGDVVHDPHPSKAGVNKITSRGIFIALRPWESMSNEECKR